MSKQMALHTVTISVEKHGSTHYFTEQYLSEHLSLAFVSSHPSVEVDMVATKIIPEDDAKVLSKYLYTSWLVQDGRIEVNGYELDPLEG